MLSTKMVQILHISDPHGESESMARLDNLARLCADCDVVALTGDCTSFRLDQLPPEWGGWPQRLKLSVPGNHDLPHTFDRLHGWHHHVPWTQRFDDLLFISLDSPFAREVEKYLRDIDLESARGVILLSHTRPQDSLADILRAFVGSRSFLILHGHEHPTGFGGTQWDQTGLLADKPYFRSHVCSSNTFRRGLGHRIKWWGGSFQCSVVQGPKGHGAAVEHATFGRGMLVKREGSGDTGKLTVIFPEHGEKRLVASFPGLTIVEER
jgi:predicted phosphodiesterase